MEICANCHRALRLDDFYRDGSWIHAHSGSASCDGNLTEGAPEALVVEG